MSAFIFTHLTITFPCIPKLFFHVLKILRIIDYFMLAYSVSKVLLSLFRQLVSVEPDLFMTNLLLGSVCLTGRLQMAIDSSSLMPSCVLTSAICREALLP